MTVPAHKEVRTPFPVPPTAPGRRAHPTLSTRRTTTTPPSPTPYLARLAVAALAVTAIAVLCLAAPAYAAPPAGPSLNSVIDNLRTWLVGILAAAATLFLTVGGLRYLAAGGDPAQVEKAKIALKSAAIGYALAILAPLLVSIVASVVGA